MLRITLGEWLGSCVSLGTGMGGGLVAQPRADLDRPPLTMRRTWYSAAQHPRSLRSRYASLLLVSRVFLYLFPHERRKRDRPQHQAHTLSTPLTPFLSSDFSRLRSICYPVFNKSKKRFSNMFPFVLASLLMSVVPISIAGSAAMRRQPLWKPNQYGQSVGSSLSFWEHSERTGWGADVAGEEEEEKGREGVVEIKLLIVCSSLSTCSPYRWYAVGERHLCDRSRNQHYPRTSLPSSPSRLSLRLTSLHPLGHAHPLSPPPPPHPLSLALHRKNSPTTETRSRPTSPWAPPGSKHASPSPETLSSLLCSRR